MPQRRYHTIVRFGLLLLCFGSLLLAAGSPAQSGKRQLPKSTPQMKEYYLSKKDQLYVRPGLTMDLYQVEIGADRKPVVSLLLKDEAGKPLDRLGLETPGVISISFILASYNQETGEFSAFTTRVQTSTINGVSATQAGTDTRGVWTDEEVGRYKYKFGTAMPADYDGTKTYTIAVYASRNLTDLLGKNFVDNKVKDFRFDGGTPETTWAAADNATCNSCHGDLSAHGGSRKDVKLCATCHSSQTVDPDTGNTVDFKVMIHKIHMGEHLPSVQAGTPYRIIGNRNSVHDYSTVVLPQDVRNCENCHKQNLAGGHVWFSKPNRNACGACHDNINWATGAGHGDRAQMDDSRCAECHVPEGEFEFDLSVKGSHTIPTKSRQLAGLNLNILSIENTGPGQTPLVTFRLFDDAGTALNPASMAGLTLMYGGSTKEYGVPTRFNARTATWNGETAQISFPSPLPAEAEGTWTLTADITRNVTIQGREGETIAVREAADNPIAHFAVTDAVAVPRRQVVSIDSCNNCHDSLALHGGQRFQINECVMCHTPEADDASVRLPDTGQPESIHLKWMIHRIHKGEELERDFTVYGFRSSVHNYNEVRYPNDLRNCQACHVAGSYGLPLPAEARATNTPRDYFSPMLPAAASCLSCHDSLDAAAHAFVNTAPFGESCATCHGPNREFSVERVHAQ